MQHDLTDLFQKTFELTPGDVIVIPCRDFSEMEAIRRSLYREMAKLRKMSKELANEIGIHRRNEEGSYAVALTRRKTSVTRAFVVSKKGGVSEIPHKAESEEVKRIEQLMLKDGYSIEDIKEYKQSAVDFFTPEGEEDDGGESEDGTDEL